VHAGDIGKAGILEALAALAPVSAIRGNNDREGWARAIPHTLALELAGARLFVIHDVNALDIDPAKEGFAAVIAGHSHMPRVEEEGGVLYVNPGSAGPRRFKLPVSVAYLHIRAGRVRAELAEVL